MNTFKSRFDSGPIFFLSSINVLAGIIGKYHVAPAPVYQFDFDASSTHHDINQVGRNITCMRQYMRQFLQESKYNDTR